MKKIAIVASGLLWATGIFAEGINAEIVGYTTVSPASAGLDNGLQSDIVGYANKELKEDYAFILTVNMFKPAGGPATLGDITASSTWVAGQDKLETMLDNGAIDQSYTFVNAEEAKEFGCPAGWYLLDDFNNDSIEDLTPYCKNNVTLAYGSGILVTVAKPTTTLTFAGAVLLEDQPVKLKKDYAFNTTGNATPQDNTLGDFLVSSDWVAGQDKLETMLDNGAIDESYTFVNLEEATEFGCYPGWYLLADFNNDSIEDLKPYCKNTELEKAGEGFFVLVAKPTVMLTIPATL